MKKFFIFVLLFNLANASWARPFVEVANALLSVIPETEEELRKDITRYRLAYKITVKKICDDNLENACDKKLHDYLLYIVVSHAPEIYEPVIWENLAVYLSKRFPKEEDLNQWQKTMLDIFMDKLDYKIYLSEA